MKIEWLFHDPRRQGRILLITGGCALALALFTQWRALAGERSSYVALHDRASRMYLDSQRIATLREAPRLVADRERPNDTLLAQIQDALAVASIRKKDWVRNEPHAAVRIPHSSYKRLGHTAVLGNVSLRQIALFLHDLVSKDPSLSVTQLRLASSKTNTSERWNATVVLAYHIFAPTN